MFGRREAPPVQAEPVGKAGGKGRPTPTRKQAEAAAKARAKVPRTRKEVAAAQRLARAESSAKVRAAMRAGDERYYLARDKGPVRRFVRDFVDSRFSVVELIIPLVLVNLVLTFTRQSVLISLANSLLLVGLLVIVVEAVRLRLKLRRELAARFPDESTKGLTYYAISRSLQMKFMRVPKAKVRIGEKLPERYR